MPRYRDDAKERIRDAVDFVALVEERTELRRSSGANYMGRCPFHEERTPSFSVNAQKKMFHCFGCGVEGDVFDYVEQMENVDFTGALELLAARTGIELEVEDEDPQAAERRRHRERLLELLERTAAFYERVLWESREAAPARVYLAERGLTEETLRTFRVGYAPSAWDTVLMSSQRAGFKARELHDAGLVVRGGRDGAGRVYDRFRSRITFPLADARGRVLGFGARTMSDNRGPKYLNTAENEIFHKGRMVYGAHLARAAAGKAGAVIVCEGYTDVLALHQSGVENVVASMGTALTEDQVGELRKLAPVIQLALDADDAGQEAMLRAARVAASSKVELRVVPLPEGRDPADVALAEGAEAVRTLVGRSVPFVRFRVERTLARGDLSTAEGKDRVIEELRPAFATIGESVLREELLATCADRLAIPPDLARTLLLGRGRGGGGGARVPAPVASEPPRRPVVDRLAQTERAFLTLCLALPEPGRRHLAAIDPDEHFTDPVARRAAAWLRDHLDAPTEGLPGDDEDLTRLVHALADRAQRVTEPNPATLETERIQLELAVVRRRLERAEPGAHAELARRRVDLQRQLDEWMDRSLG
ncbi:MAG TPA: DNA primase [Capillimicrobium sp.]|nr:DNA primase [Capillimicrobium sp.]